MAFSVTIFTNICIWPSSFWEASVSLDCIGNRKFSVMIGVYHRPRCCIHCAQSRIFQTYSSRSSYCRIHCSWSLCGGACLAPHRLAWPSWTGDQYGFRMALGHGCTVYHRRITIVSHFSSIFDFDPVSDKNVTCVSMSCVVCRGRNRTVSWTFINVNCFSLPFLLPSVARHQQVQIESPSDLHREDLTTSSRHTRFSTSVLFWQYSLITDVSLLSPPIVFRHLELVGRDCGCAVTLMEYKRQRRV